MKSTAQLKLKAILKKRSLITHEEWLDINYGKHGTKRREEYEKGSGEFLHQVMLELEKLELEKEEKLKARKRRLPASGSAGTSSRP